MSKVFVGVTDWLRHQEQFTYFCHWLSQCLHCVFLYIFPRFQMGVSYMVRLEKAKWVCHHPDSFFLSLWICSTVKISTEKHVKHFEQIKEEFVYISMKMDYGVGSRLASQKYQNCTKSAYIKTGGGGKCRFYFEWYF